MQIIIVGCGNVGMTLAEQLSKEGHNITIIEQKSTVVENAVNSFDVMGIVGNGASYSMMKDAGIEHADLMIAVTNSDELNLLCCLIAKKAGNCHTIARVRNYVYKMEIDYIKEELGLSMIINPEEAAADEAARLLKFPLATKIETFARSRAEMVTFQVEEGSKLCGKALKDLPSDLRKNVLFAVASRGGNVVIPDGSYEILAGDEMTVIGSRKDMISLFRNLGLPTSGVKNCMIVGGGDIGVYLARQLDSMGIDVKIFEKDSERCKQLVDMLPGAMVIHADGTDRESLMEEGLPGMESFVAATGIDEENIMISLFAKSVSKAKTITKVHRANYDGIIGGLGLNSILYPKNITAGKIVQYVRSMNNSMGINIESLYKISEDRVEVLEFKIRENTDIVGVPLKDLKLKKGILVASIIHKGKAVSPGGNSMIEVGDSVIFVTRRTGVSDLSELLD